jgi:hypothetical protein
MTPPRDILRANDNGSTSAPNHAEYEMLGHFEPRDAERILNGLEEQHVPFKVEECSQHGIFDVWPWRRKSLCIYVRPADKKKAEATSDENTARSRAAAGICYVAIGGAIGAIVLLQIRSGVRTMPYRSGEALPLEFVAGIAGTVVFMGLVQLVIAVILGLRQRRRSHVVQPNHLTNR